MSVFFSSTDMGEIKDNSKSHNFYLSLIVNNNMDTIAKVVSYAEAKDSVDASFLARDENGEEYEVKKQKLNLKESIHKFYDCQIIKEDIKPRVDARFTKAVDTIIKEAEKRKTTSYGVFGQEYSTPLENSYNRDKNYFQKHCNPWEKEILANKNNFQHLSLETSPKNSFNKFQDRLPETYKRCHKSCIANISQIKDVEPVSGIITFKDGSTCDIGPKYKADLMEVLKTYGNFE